MCDNNQQVQVNIIQRNSCEGDSSRSTGGLLGIPLLVLLGVGCIWLVFAVLGSAFHALGHGLTSLGAGIASINWLQLIGGILLGIVLWVLAVAAIVYSVAKGMDYLSSREERRKARTIIDLEPIEAPQLNAAPKALPEPKPVFLMVEPLNAYDHGNH